MLVESLQICSFVPNSKKNGGQGKARKKSTRNINTGKKQYRDRTGKLFNFNLPTIPYSGQKTMENVSDNFMKFYWAVRQY